MTEHKWPSCASLPTVCRAVLKYPRRCSPYLVDQQGVTVLPRMTFLSGQGTLHTAYYTTDGELRQQDLPDDFRGARSWEWFPRPVLAVRLDFRIYKHHEDKPE